MADNFVAGNFVAGNFAAGNFAAGNLAADSSDRTQTGRRCFRPRSSPTGFRSDRARRGPRSPGRALFDPVSGRAADQVDSRAQSLSASARWGKGCPVGTHCWTGWRALRCRLGGLPGAGAGRCRWRKGPPRPTSFRPSKCPRANAAAPPWRGPPAALPRWPRTRPGREKRVELAWKAGWAVPYKRWDKFRQFTCCKARKRTVSVPWLDKSGQISYFDLV